MTSEDPRTIVLGFDALAFEYLDEFEDELDNFGQLRANGTEAPLTSTHPPWTGSAWPSMYTGTDPSMHNAFGFFDYEDSYPDEASIISRNDVQQPAIWNYLTAINEPTIVLNVPVTHPAESFTGALIPGYLASADADGFPADIRNELDEALGEEYTIYSDAEMANDKERKLNSYVELINLRARAAEYLLQNWDWSVAIIQVQKTDAVFHNFARPAAFKRVYKAADDLIGTILHCTENPNIVVCSDHGIGRTNGYKIFINEYLREHGFVQANTNGNNYGTSLSSVKQSIVNPSEEGSQKPDFVNRVLSTGIASLSEIGVTPAKILRVAQRAGLESELERLTPSNLRSAAERTVDWRNSIAYCRAVGELGVRINLEGRDPSGIVAQEDYESVRSELITLLSSLQTPDGRRVFEFVDRAESVNYRSDPGSGPDVVFRPRDMNHLVLPSLVGEQFLPLNEFNHKVEGVFIGSGPSFDSTATPDTLSLVDIAPIIMASTDFAIPERMIGTVPNDLLSVPVEKAVYPDVEYGLSESTDQSDDMESRLEDLGYL